MQLDKQRAVRAVLGLAAVASLAVVGWLDYRTGPWLSFALLYVTPVMAAAWWLGRGPALAAGLTAGVAWFVAEAHARQGEPTFDLVWNSTSRLVMLVAMGLMVVRIRADRLKLQAANALLSSHLDSAEALARTDALTSLPNRRAFIERLAAELARAKRSGEAICLAYLDIDNFKRLNDLRGHAEGDEFLGLVARTIKETVRKADVPARLGGDEFAVLFIDARQDAAEAMAQRLLHRIRGLGDAYPGLDLGASVGMAFFSAPPEDAAELLQRADAAMYAAKSGGKHRFSLWSNEVLKPARRA
jgi:diguanylate cyclase (GGDEF)-like protein